MKVTYLLRDSKSSIPQSIIARARWKSEQCNITTPIKIMPAHWSDKKQRDKGSNQRSEVNHFLTDYEQKLNDLFSQFILEKNRNPIGREFSQYVKQIDTKRSNGPDAATFYECLQLIIQENKKRLSRDNKPINRNSVVNSYNQLQNVLREFESASKTVVTFDSISLEFYDAFVDWCEEEKDYSPNNIGKHIKNIKAVMNRANEIEVTNNLVHRNKRFVTIKEKRESIYLNENELSQLNKLDLSDKPHLEKARDAFLIGAWTGLRFSDYSRINRHHVHTDFIKIDSSKTNTLVEVPLVNAGLKSILRKYDNRCPAILEQNLNDYIKRIGKMAGIVEVVPEIRRAKHKEGKTLVEKCELITTHTGRRSFATNRYLEGLSALDIMPITGHKTEKAFLTYIKARPKEQRQRMAEHLMNQGHHLKTNAS